jgi:hypothetical protein
MTPPLAFHPLLIHLTDGTTVLGHYAKKSAYWPEGFRDANKVLIDPGKIVRWEYA